jgi:hypothetical protein
MLCRSQRPYFALLEIQNRVTGLNTKKLGHGLQHGWGGNDTVPASITARERIELVGLSADHAHLSNMRPEEEAVLTVTLIGAAFLLGLFFGAGIYEAGARKHREQTDQCLIALAQSHVDLDGLVQATGELATLNYHILEARHQSEKDFARTLVQKIQGKPN